MKRYYPDLKQGLTHEQVQERIENGLVNEVYSNTTRSIKSIVFKNVFTLFNLLNVVLGVIVFLVGSYKNVLFLGVVFCNTIISLYQEVKSKKVVDKLSLLSMQRVFVIRDGIKQKIEQFELVLDDLMILSSGSQVPSDAIIVSGECDVNESLLTGEERGVHKEKGDLLYSGSFILTDTVIAKVEHIGKENYTFKITERVKDMKEEESLLIHSLKKIIQYISIFIIPLGCLLFYNQFMLGTEWKASVIHSVAGIISMIPTGLVLLTSTVFALSALRLAKKNILVQDLYCTENLARTDTICFDKTGTLTTGEMEVVKWIDLRKKENGEEILKKVLYNLENENQTMKALKEKYSCENNMVCQKKIPFSSKYKYSAVTFEEGTYLLGAPDILKKDLNLDEYSDYRVLFLGFTKENFQKGEIPHFTESIGLILLKEKMRENAFEMIQYFYHNQVDVRIISGDNVKTLEKISKIVGIRNMKALDTSLIREEELASVCHHYNVFGRVTPEGKKIIVSALQEKGHIVTMTGDGVNDVLALKEANCSIALSSGVDAVRNVSSLVLLSSSFEGIVDIVKEGRRSINNLGRSACLFLTKTLYSALLTIAFIFLNKSYPFVPIHITLLSFVTIGIPSFVLALEPNDSPISDQFLPNIFKKIIPPALTVFLNIFVMSFLKDAFSLSVLESSSVCVILVAIIGFMLIYDISRPFNFLRVSLLWSMMIIFVLVFTFFKELFSLTSLTFDMYMIVFVLGLISIFLYGMFSYLVNVIFDKVNRKRKQTL